MNLIESEIIEDKFGTDHADTKLMQLQENKIYDLKIKLI